MRQWGLRHERVVPWSVAAVCPAPADGGSHDAWRALAWTLKAAENAGRPAETLLAALPARSDIATVRAHLHRYLQPVAAAGVLPWLPANPTAVPADYARHLDTTETLVQQRQLDLTTTAFAERPAWLAGLGTAPVTDAKQYTAWRQHVAVVAAFRDQHQITIDDPARPLGAYIPAEHAGHRAYLTAANAVLAARHPHTPGLDSTTARLAADLYLALPDSRRDTITDAVAQRLGADWLGPHHGDADTLITAPMYATALHTELIQRGHLHAAPIPEPTSPATPPPLIAETVPGRQMVCDPPMREQAQPQRGIDITW
ncbi:hypothetical protein [Actinoplanes sp. NPDC051859]|uniref:hypothetical protein n=1 Tax=Actinoplanes sp. NPDC051859 TaxID=3363909 RepID=UPI0037989DFC